MDEKAKKQTLLMIPYGLQVLGAAHGGKATVATVNWVTQASFNPPLVVVGIKKDSGCHAMVKDSKAFALSMLGSGQKGIAGAFFRHVEPKDGKFGDFAYETGKNGAPIVSDAPAAVECAGRRDDAAARQCGAGRRTRCLADAAYAGLRPPPGSRVAAGRRRRPGAQHD